VRQKQPHLPLRLGRYWQLAKLRAAAVVGFPAVTESVAIASVKLVCMLDGLQSGCPADPGMNALAPTV